MKRLRVTFLTFLCMIVPFFILFYFFIFLEVGPFSQLHLVFFALFCFKFSKFFFIPL